MKVMRVKIIKTNKVVMDDYSFFNGLDTVEFFRVDITVHNPNETKLTHIGGWFSGCLVEGQKVALAIKASSALEARFKLQQAVEVVGAQVRATEQWFYDAKSYDQGCESGPVSSKEEAEKLAVAPWRVVLRGTAYEVDEVLNLTQHNATDEQAAAGVVEPANKAAVQAALTFDAIPSVEEMAARAALLAAIAKDSGAASAMIGGAPFFMSALERALTAAGIKPAYAFSQRESVETIREDGSVVKTNVFKHVGFVG